MWLRGQGGTPSGGLLGKESERGQARSAKGTVGVAFSLSAWRCGGRGFLLVALEVRWGQHLRPLPSPSLPLQR